ncbi:MAG: catechol 2,3-dioxygenase-like lactoylglutathione lyase family enzyme [Planctomycetota bacterium]|jgi:catechol 2,3-dioxygenase-like lactoylglutathione lyase family enzyme
MNHDRITANLPSRDFEATEAFYARLGFATEYRGDGWMILNRDGMHVEFFPHPELNPKESWFSASMRLCEIDALHAEWSALGIAKDGPDFPRIGSPIVLDGSPRMFTLLDPDGSLWRVMEMGPAD